MAIKQDIVAFLRSDPAIQKINFEFDGFRVYPQAYAVDIAGLIDAGTIGVKVTSVMNPGAGASYYSNYDEFWVPPGFSTGSASDCALLVHEATHAHMDNQRIGAVDVGRSEAIAYLAEAVFREAQGLGPLSGEFLRLKAHALAKAVLGGGYAVSSAQVTSLIMTARSEPHYAEKPPTMTYSGF